MREIHIVGGGLAGLSLGIRLRETGIPVRITEAGAYPRHRVCGEFISGVSRETLTFLGIEDLLSGGLDCVSTTWYSPKGKFYEADLPAPAIALSRFTLDRLLADRFQKKDGRLVTDTRYSATSPPEPGVILASGRVREKESSWLGLKCHLRNFDPGSDLEMHLGEQGYLGICRVEGGRANACGLFRVRPDLSLNKTNAVSTYLEACGLYTLAETIRSADVDPDSCAAVSAFHFGEQENPSRNEIQIGDRFSMIGPFTGNGMSMAFQSAAIVAPVVESFSHGEISWPEASRHAAEALRKTFRRRLCMASLFHPFLLRPGAQAFLIGLGRSGLLPFRPFLRMVR